MCTYVCMYICTCAHMYVCMYICAHPPYTCTHVYTLKYLSVLNDRDLCCPNWLFHEPQVMGFTWLINMWMCVHLCVRVDIRGQLAGPVFFLREGSRDWTQVGSRHLFSSSHLEGPQVTGFELWLWAWHVATTQEVGVCWSGSLCLLFLKLFLVGSFFAIVRAEHHKPGGAGCSEPGPQGSQRPNSSLCRPIWFGFPIFQVKSEISVFLELHLVF